MTQAGCQAAEACFSFDVGWMRCVNKNTMFCVIRKKIIVVLSLASLHGFIFLFTIVFFAARLQKKT
jgi:hypothetical protein